jgi:hypothetical protein
MKNLALTGAVDCARANRAVTSRSGTREYLFIGLSTERMFDSSRAPTKQVNAPASSAKPEPCSWTASTFEASQPDGGAGYP